MKLGDFLCSYDNYLGDVIVSIESLKIRKKIEEMIETREHFDAIIKKWSVSTYEDHCGNYEHTLYIEILE